MHLMSYSSYPSLSSLNFLSLSLLAVSPPSHLCHISPLLLTSHSLSPLPISHPSSYLPSFSLCPLSITMLSHIFMRSDACVRTAKQFPVHPLSPLPLELVYRYVHHIFILLFVDRPRRSEGNTGQKDVEAGWWTTSGKVGLTPLARVTC